LQTGSLGRNVLSLWIVVYIAKLPLTKHLERGIACVITSTNL
jgi:hypothetical protein